jgi:hypothetical protein
MTTDHVERHVVAHPGEVAPTTSPGQPETREGHDTTREQSRARLTRRRLILGGGAAGLVLVTSGWGLIDYLRRDSQAATQEPGLPLPERTPGLDQEKLTLRRITRPETLSPPTFAEAVANVGQAIQYAVNYNDAALLGQVIPGGQAGMLQPGQFALRADFIEGYRASSTGTMNDDPDDPRDTRYYPWGFTMTLVDMPPGMREPVDEGLITFSAHAQVTIGDLPPLVNGNPHVVIEPPQTFTAEVALTRIRGLTRDGNYDFLPNIDGTPGRGWGLANISKMYPVPKAMTGQNLPRGYSEVPELFEQYSL